MPKITQDVVDLIQKKVRETDLIKKHYEKERKFQSRKLKTQTIEMLKTHGRISRPLLVRKFKITFKAACKLYDWALKEALKREIKKSIKQSKNMDKEDIKKYLKRMGVSDKLIDQHLDEIINRLNKEDTEKTIKLFEHAEQLILSIFKHLNIDRHQCLQIFMRVIANQTADLPENYLDTYLNFIKVHWKINSSINGI